MKEHYVYIIQCGKRGPIKVGISEDVSARIANMQTGCPSRLIEIARIPCDNEKQARYLEKRFHYKFRAFRLHGEWFDKKALRMIPKQTEPAIQRAIINMELDRRHLETVSHLL